MKTSLIAVAAFVSGSLLLIPLAAQTGIFDALFVDGTIRAEDVVVTDDVTVTDDLTVSGNALLPSNSIQEAEIDIDNAPTDDYFLQWDQTSGKPTWQEIGFDIGDWSNLDSSPSANCPDSVGSTTAGSGPWGLLNFNADLSIWEMTSVLAVASKPVLTYDITYLGTQAITVLYIQHNGGEKTLLFQSTAASGTFRRVTGISTSLESGPVAVLFGRRITPNVAVYICTAISSVAMVS